MSSALGEIRDLQRQAKLDRNRGDALRRAGREAEACQAFEAGIIKLERCLELFEGEPAAASGEPVAETFGSLAGLLRRLDRNVEAYKRYEQGAAIERNFKLPTTYNRVNEIKYALLTGAETVAAVEGRARKTAESLFETLSNPSTQQLGDDGWAWADLGDCRGLTGELTDATRAYTTFVAKAGVRAPATTTAVLQNIAEVLDVRQDPGRERVSQMIAVLRSLMNPSGGSR
jgi:tetratricopeptide (TPR) repeat protein